jgi:hypothetical protein
MNLDRKIVLASFGAMFSQTHLVTLAATAAANWS